MSLNIPGVKYSPLQVLQSYALHLQFLYGNRYIVVSFISFLTLSPLQSSLSLLAMQLSCLQQNSAIHYFTTLLKLDFTLIQFRSTV